MRTNLLSEMQRRKITIAALAQTLGIHRNSMRNKLCDVSPFTLDEAIQFLVPGRGAMLSDFILNSLGIAFGILSAIFTF